LKFYYLHTCQPIKQTKENFKKSCKKSLVIKHHLDQANEADQKLTLQMCKQSFPCI